jgi:hypothetical protein
MLSWVQALMPNEGLVSDVGDRASGSLHAGRLADRFGA